MIDAIHTTIHARFKREIEGLRLPSSPRVIVSKRYHETEFHEPNVIYICRAAEQPGAGTFGSATIGFPAVLYMSRGTGGAATENAEIVSLWRDAIQDHFDDKREPIKDLGIERVTPLICRVDYGSDFLDDFWQRRWDIAHMAVIAFVRKLRA